MHYSKSTPSRFLTTLHRAMKRRTQGKVTRRPDLYLGLDIVSSDVFKEWALGQSNFLSLFKQWCMSNYDRKLTPSVNRIDSSKGYTLNNIEWMTTSQNCGLSASVKKLKQKKAVYNLLGVTVNV